MFDKSSLPGISLTAAGLIALADLKTIAYRTALKGTSSYFDILFLAPGIHCQQSASEVNGGEYPATGAMTTGYVFRVENQATVNYLQRVGESGHLVNVKVLPNSQIPRLRLFSPAIARCASCKAKLPRVGLFSRCTSVCETCLVKVPAVGLLSREALTAVLYASGLAQTLIVLYLLLFIRDLWGFGVMAMLIVARLCNIAVIKERSMLGWKGASEPGVEGDLLILLSQDRWIRMRGMVDDIKAVTAGQWLKEQTGAQSFFVSLGTLLVYASAALAGNSSTVGNLLIACLLLISVAMLGVCNSLTKTQEMFGRMLYQVGEPRKYDRRLTMAQELIAETKRDDWALGMGLIVAEEAAKIKKALM
ncbi:hypothetical protein OE88DRAFT_1664762 [Heliocybe sulcata]|uniref:Uncharacterized protein n=1 Tax=Heliocybe sulcata TaxID=5364 RepID=A0A5C3MU32_9AGAM|nr:hypothetical protein OE88DRAFT_1664762 [Heliocybe sulcata]